MKKTHDRNFPNYSINIIMEFHSAFNNALSTDGSHHVLIYREIRISDIKPAIDLSLGAAPNPIKVICVCPIVSFGQAR